MQFTRTEMLPPRAPPVLQSGALKWIRENLFSSWLNAFLTIMSVALVYFFVALSAPWLLHAVWNANSLSECRSIIARCR